MRTGKVFGFYEKFGIYTRRKVIEQTEQMKDTGNTKFMIGNESEEDLLGIAKVKIDTWK